MKRYILIAFTIILSVSSLQAQVNKEVEVTKAYIPVIERASKPALKAEMSDSTLITPEIDYGITPLSINTPLENKPINPATVTYWEFNKPTAGQIKVGAGYPLNTLLQAVASSHNASVGYMTAHVDHRGNFSKISDVNAQRMLNEVDLAGGLYLGYRTLEANLNYVNNSYRRYAFNQVDDPKVNYQSVGGGLRFGDSFIDLTHFNYMVEADYSSLWDIADNHSNRINVSTIMGQDIGVVDLLFDAGYQFIKEDSFYKNNRLQLGATILSNISVWKIDAGVQYNYTGGNNTSKHYFLPKLHIRHCEAMPISPFVVIDGTLSGNSYRELLEINPYVATFGANAKSSANYRLSGGFEGLLFDSKLAYKIFVDYTIGRNIRYWALNVVEDSAQVYSNYFDIRYGNQVTSSYNADFEYRPNSSLTFSMNLDYNDYHKKQSEGYMYTMPKYQAKMGVDYSARRFAVGVSANYFSKREATVNHISASPASSSISTAELPGAVDLSAYATYKLNGKYSLFLEGSNLCNQNIYEWALYRDFGASVTAGVKIQF